LKGNLFNSSWN